MGANQEGSSSSKDIKGTHNKGLWERFEEGAKLAWNTSRIGVSLPPITFVFQRNLAKAEEAKENYQRLLAEAKSEQDIFKYLLLIDASALDEYAVQTRLQAEQTFDLSLGVAISGFILIVFGILLSLVPPYFGFNAIEPAYVSAIAGIVVEIVSSIFFYLYNRTLQQINRFHDKMLASKQKSMALLANSFIEDKDKKYSSIATLSKELIVPEKINQ